MVAAMSQGLTQSARDVAVIGCLAVAASVGLFIWDGGSTPSAADVETGLPVASSIPASTLAGTTVAPAATTAAQATTVAPAAPAGDVTGLPVPANGVENPAPPPGTRVWTVTGSTLAAVRDAYFPALSAAGWTAAPAAPATAAVEVYTMTDAAGAQLTLTLTQAGADVQVVATP
jgi:hypothetical protein